MPVSYDLPEYQNAASVEDVDKYQKLPFYLAALEARYFPQWQIFNQLFGKIPWTPNMGSTLRGVRATPTPVGQQQFYPALITGVPNKDVFETLEFTEETGLHMHDMDSKQFYFLPSFQDFRENQIDFVHKDMIRQSAIKSDTFYRTYAFQKAPYIIVAGNNRSSIAIGQNALINAPTQAGTITSANAPKPTNYLQALVACVGTNLTLALVDYAVNVLRDDIGAPFFEGTLNTPKDNELIKGKYVLIGSSEAYQQFKWDPNFSTLRSINLNVVTDGFRGSIFDEVTYKTERYPLRIMADGSTPAPEVVNFDNEPVPNPDYVNAPYEVAYLVGADAMKTVKVGPPPKAFSSGSMDADKFFKLRWNGEIRLTDQVLVTYANGAIDMNNRGRFLKFIGALTLGCIPCNKRAFLPIVFARKRVTVI